MIEINTSLVTAILDEFYDEVKKFFYEVIESKCPNKILVTRRSYILYKIFEKIYKEEHADNGEEILGNTRIYNTHSISLINATDENVLIIDDIIVNGRTMMGIVKKLNDKNIPKSKISIWCLRCNSKAKFLESIKPFFKHVIYVTQYEWKRFSDKLTDVVISSNIGYVSFVDSYKIDGLSLAEFDSEDRKCGEGYNCLTVVAGLHINNDIEMNDKSNNICSKIIWGDLLKKWIVDEYKIKACIRIYQKANDTSLLVIPFVFLPSVDAKSVETYCSSLLNELGLEYPETFNEICDEENSILFYKWTINKISEFILAQYIKKYYTHKKLVCQKYLVCDESYLGYNHKQMCKYSNQTKVNLEKIICDKWSNEEIAFCKRTLSDLLIKNSNNFEVSYKRYIDDMRKIDDDRANDNINNRYQGIRISDILDLIGEFSEEEIISFIINTCDSGENAYLIECANDETSGQKIVAGFLRHGEQAFREYYMIHREVYEVFYQFFLQKRTTNLNEFMELARYFDKKYACNKFTSFVIGINKENYISDLMAVTPNSLHAKCIVLDPEVEVRDYIYRKT